MKTARLHVIVFVTGMTTVTAGEFINLDFEDAIWPLVPIPDASGHPVPVERAIPGWGLFVGSYQQTGIRYPTLNLSGSAGAAYIPASSIAVLDVGHGMLVHLASGVALEDLKDAGVTLSQTGHIPESARSITFEAVGKAYDVRLNGTVLSLVPAGRNLYAADISGFAGSDAELSFITGFDSMAPIPEGGLYIDTISFSPNPIIPEPSAWALLAFGGAGLAWATRRRDR